MKGETMNTENGEILFAQHWASEKLECREKLLFHKRMGWMRLKAQTTAQNLVIYLK